MDRAQKEPSTVVMPMIRIVLLNALPLNMFGLQEGEFVEVVIERISIEKLKQLVAEADEIACFVRHRATVELLSRILGVGLEPNTDLYRYRPSDRIVVVTLRTPIRGREATEVKLEDLEIYVVRPV